MYLQGNCLSEKHITNNVYNQKKQQLQPACVNVNVILFDWKCSLLYTYIFICTIDYSPNFQSIN